MSTFQGHLKFGDSNDGTPISISYLPPKKKNLWSHHRGIEASAKHWSIAHQKCMVTVMTMHGRSQAAKNGDVSTVSFCIFLHFVAKK